jgi:hypothetical protein
MLIAAVLFVALVGFVLGDIALFRAWTRRKRDSSG